MLGPSLRCPLRAPQWTRGGRATTTITNSRPVVPKFQIRVDFHWSSLVPMPGKFPYRTPDSLPEDVYWASVMPFNEPWPIPGGTYLGADKRRPFLRRFT